MTERIAILADIHANSLALDAVLADITRGGGADEFWVLGDLAALGYDPAGVLERLRALPARFIHGNTDRYLFTGEWPGPSLQAVAQDIQLLPRLLHLSSSFAWTTGALAGGDWLDWLETFPLDLRWELPGGKRLLAVHASPGTDDGSGIRAQMIDAQVRPLIAGAQADLILVGHTHIPFDRSLNGVRIINPGSVSNPFPPDLRASYATLIIDAGSYRIEHHRVEYDREAVIAATRRVRQPSLDYITRHLRGEVQPGS